MDAKQRPAVVMDCGSGYTKLGLAGNTAPAFIFPTAVATTADDPARSSNNHPFQRQHADAIADLSYAFGDAALAAHASPAHTVHHPVRGGLIEDWVNVERLWQYSVHQCLRVNPEDHYFVLTEPPSNTPENREQMAEIMFETFRAPGLHIGMQATLVLYATLRGSDPGKKLTGTVVDIGDGATHVMPVVDGYVLADATRSFPLAGRDVTRNLQHLLRRRGAAIPPEQSLEVARGVKETLGYTCADPAQEEAKHAADPGKYCRQYVGTHRGTGKQFTVDVSTERFLGPEIFFSPHLYTSTPVPPLPRLVDDVIQSCPIDTRRELYSNIVLSGGTAMFKDFGTRLSRDLSKLAVSRMGDSSTPLQVGINKSSRRQYAVWLGGSVLASSPGFDAVCRTREEYEEHGPAICRTNDVFRDTV